MGVKDEVPTKSLPAGWDLLPVESRGEVRAGKALAATGPGKQRPYLRTKNVFDGRIEIDDVLQMPMTESEFERYGLRSGDVLLNEGQTIEQVGRCSIYRGEYPEPCAIQNQLVRFRAYRGTSAAFAAHLFRYCQKTGVFRNIALQTTSVAHLGMSRFAKLQLTWPQHELEQVVIAEALDDADAHIEALEHLIAKKRAIKQGVMQELLTGRRRLPGFSGEWQVKPLGVLFDFSGGLSASRAQLSSDGHPYLHYGDIHGSTKSFIDMEAEHDAIPRLNVPLAKVSRSSLLDDGDVVFVDASEDDEGTSKHVVVVNTNRRPFISGLHTIVAKARGDELDKAFRRFCFQSRDIRNQFHFFAVGTKVSGISKTNIVKIELSYPPIREQEAIANILCDMDDELDILESRVGKARLMKGGMMQELLSGRTRLV